MWPLSFDNPDTNFNASLLSAFLLNYAVLLRTTILLVSSGFLFLFVGMEYNKLKDVHVIEAAGLNFGYAHNMYSGGAKSC